MDLADASLVATAETRHLPRVFKLDSDFLVYRMHDPDAFDILPQTPGRIDRSASSAGRRRAEIPAG